MNNEISKICKNERILSIVEGRIHVAKRAMEKAKNRTLADADDLSKLVNFMVKTQEVEGLLKIKLNVLRNIEDLKTKE